MREKFLGYLPGSLGIPAAGRSGGQAFRLYIFKALGAKLVFATILNAMLLNNSSTPLARF